MASFKARIGWKRPGKKKINIVVLFRSYPMRNRKFQKNSKKIKQIPLCRHFKPKQFGKGKERG